MNPANALLGHGRILYACGHLYAQCRCVDHPRMDRSLTIPCPACAPTWEGEISPGA